jgi:Tol biopolymer transport system component
LLHGRDESVSGHYFSWLPDGHSIVSSQLSALGGPHMMYQDFRVPARRLTQGAGWEWYPSLSPDGRTLVFLSGDAGYDLVEVPLDGSRERDLIATTRSQIAPAWAPDGIHFAYVTDRSGSAEIWVRNRVDDSERLLVSSRDLAGQTGALLDCAISPDGSRIAYRRSHHGAHEIWIASLSGDAPVRLFEDAKNLAQRGPSWSPDGNWIAYYSSRDGKPAVLKARVGANAPPELVSFVSVTRPVRWSPRGDWIAADDDRKLKLLDPNGKQARVISEREWLTYGWANDGEAVYGIRVAEDRHLMLGRIELAVSGEKRIADLGPMPAGMEIGVNIGDFPFRGFSMSPDGKSFLTSRMHLRGDLWMLENFNLSRTWWQRLTRR